jgi:hypothetical protein
MCTADYAHLIIEYWRWDISVGITLSRGLNDRGSDTGRGKFFIFTILRLVVGPTQPPIQWVPLAISQGVQWPQHEADHSPPIAAEVRDA